LTEASRKKFMKKAINMSGKEVDLPRRPVKEEGETQDDFEEMLSGWNHRVLPLLDLSASHGG
jgi:hypothetical protein